MSDRHSNASYTGCRGENPFPSVTFHPPVHQSFISQSLWNICPAHVHLHICTSCAYGIQYIQFIILQILMHLHESSLYLIPIRIQFLSNVFTLLHLTSSLVITLSLSIIKYLIACQKLCMTPTLCSSNQQVADSFVAHLARLTMSLSTSGRCGRGLQVVYKVNIYIIKGDSRSF